MPIHVTAEEEFRVGEEVVVEGPAPDGAFSTFFEDDGNTGYFYALDTSEQTTRIKDALHIYNVNNVTDRDKPSIAKIGWSADNQKAVLLINGYPHAIFDFVSRQGYCRTGFPPGHSASGWSAGSRAWNDTALELFN